MAPHREMDAGALRWLIKTARQNLWRTGLDFDDLLQEGAMCWQIILHKYPKVKQRSHLMALFKTTYINRLHKLSYVKTRRGEEVPLEVGVHDPADPASDLFQFIMETPPMLRQALLTLLARPELPRSSPTKPGQRRRTTNEWLCEVAGLDPAAHNLHKDLLDLLVPKPGYV